MKIKTFGKPKPASQKINNKRKITKANKTFKDPHSFTTDISCLPNLNLWDSLPLTEAFLKHVSYQARCLSTAF